MSDGLMLITGASSGVGRSLVHRFAPSFEIIAVARRRKVMDDEFDRYDAVTTHEVDLGRPDEVAGFCDGVLSNSMISHAINNAGVNRAGEVAELARETIDESIQINALAPLAIMQALLPRMAEQQYGRIINVTSGAPLNCFPGFASYSGSKALLNAITVTAAREYEDTNIKINLMSPGPVRSEMSPQSTIEPDVCHSTAEYLANLPHDGPTGRFFWLGHEVPLFPDLTGIDWLAGDGGGRLRKIF